MSGWKWCGVRKPIVAAVGSAVAQAAPWSSPGCFYLQLSCLGEKSLEPLALTLLWVPQKWELLSRGSGASLCCRAAVPPRDTSQNWEVC